MIYGALSFAIVCGHLYTQTSTHDVFEGEYDSATVSGRYEIGQKVAKMQQKGILFSYSYFFLEFGTRVERGHRAMFGHETISEIEVKRSGKISVLVKN